MLRRLHPEQPDSFAFTPANQAWADAQVAKYPEGRQASAIIPLLWRAQEQHGWLTRAAIEHVAAMLDMAYIRALEVATFYFMFQLQPVGSVAHFQICGTTPCMLCGSEELVKVCREKIAKQPHKLSDDGKFSWEEVECLGACSNAPMAQIGKDYYEDLDAESFAKLIDDMAAGKVPTPGSQKGRFASEPLGGATTLTDYTGESANGSVALAAGLGDTLKRIDGTEVPLVAPWRDHPRADGQPMGGGDVAELVKPADKPSKKSKDTPKAKDAPSDKSPQTKTEAPKAKKSKSATPEPAKAVPVDAPTEAGEQKPEMLTQARGTPDDLKKIKGVGPKLEGTLNELGVWHFWQIASWTAAEIAWVDTRLKFKGRIERDGWIDQAKTLAEGGETEFSSRS
ncbi:NADH-quinone oxidoreductase chain 2 [Roseibaca ekhonensis]|uniref:NADH-quinone oxidoreductase chain 2 n=1 Tax=Roseinatronobacter ekhonensis TaxID=254356 RepID=A0A3B0MSR6_9RHOB|nr:NADH-quinone oxidoreductase subunit E [Roseibaca ekhonensis]SUZ32669.1 NADH-quinone oxidoreductase chain 2 [Roseibaca ekhonensis]